MSLFSLLYHFKTLIFTPFTKTIKTIGNTINLLMYN